MTTILMKTGLLGTMLLVSSCSFGAEKGWTLAAIDAPTTVKRGQPIQVSLVTGSPNTCRPAAWIDFQVDEGAKRVLLTPYRQRESGPCGQMPTEFTVTGSFVPRSAGTYRLEAPGWDKDKQQTTVWTADVVVTE